MGRTIIMVHGRGIKPPRRQLAATWKDALRYSISRDFPEAAGLFEQTWCEMVYYGDLSNLFFQKKDGSVPIGSLDERLVTMSRLKRYRADEFNGQSYRQVPGYMRYSEAIALRVGSVAKALRLGRPYIEIYAKDMRQYWNQDSDFGTEVRTRMLGPVRNALDRGDKVLVLSHSLGAMISWDIFWKLSRTGEYREEYGDRRKVDMWITMGSPLGDVAIRQNLKGFHASTPRKYPSNVRRWFNVWAEDDFICHDGAIRDDYHEMLEHGVCECVEDAQIYNLAVKAGRSDPHNVLGYLMHPVLAEAVACWLVRAEMEKAAEHNGGNDAGVALVGDGEYN
ncbi:MAG: hypothetical protein ACLFOY_06865 [Desulfatibacillaceae bacterium]